jgi:REP element-mobilizing transposase RayT
MPEHFHILIGEPEKGNPSTVLQVLKQSVARRLLKPARKRRRNQPMLWTEADSALQKRHFWQVRFYDFNVYSNEKRAEKMRYMHENPVKRGLVPSPESLALEQLPRVSLPRVQRSENRPARCDSGEKTATFGVINIDLTPPSRKHRARMGHPDRGSPEEKTEMGKDGPPSLALRREQKSVFSL